MKKILFFIHDLREGGAEKVLVNLVNNMDLNKFDITVMTVFDEGINKQFLNDNIHYKYCFKKAIRGNSHYMKLFSPEFLHTHLIKDDYDIEVAYLEGPCSRVISGCPNKNTKLVSWIHIEQKTSKIASCSFRNKKEAEDCYNKFNQIVGVSKNVKEYFLNSLNITAPMDVYYNTNETCKIISDSKEDIESGLMSFETINMVGVGKLLSNKGFDRLLKIVRRLKSENYKIHLYILGIGPMEDKLKKFISDNDLKNEVTLLGYKTNPYKYVAKSDLFVCSSFAEGFSTAATEALIVGTPVCTVEVAGMKEMLGENNEFGVVVENDDEALYKGIKDLLDHPDKLAFYKEKAEERGKFFSTENTVKAVEEMFFKL